MQKNNDCLLIDDDIDDREIFVMCAEKANPGINCRVAENALVAISLLTETGNIPAYIFIDVNMPKMNGMECLKRLKTMEKLKGTIFYMYSTTGEDVTVSESKELGARFLIKPAKPSELVEKLSQIFGSE